MNDQHLVRANGKCSKGFDQSVGLLRQLVSLLLFLLAVEQRQKSLREILPRHP